MKVILEKLQVVFRKYAHMIPIFFHHLVVGICEGANWLEGLVVFINRLEVGFRFDFKETAECIQGTHQKLVSLVFFLWVCLHVSIKLGEDHHNFGHSFCRFNMFSKNEIRRIDEHLKFVFDGLHLFHQNVVDEVVQL